MKVIRKSDGKVIDVEPVFRMDDPSDNQRYYGDGDDRRYLPSDLDFEAENVKEAKKNANAFASDSDLRISVAKLREVLSLWLSVWWML